MFLRDVRYALRTLRKSPAFTLAAALALALAIGANTAVFSVVSALLNPPIIFAEPDRVAAIFPTNAEQNINQAGMSSDDFLDFRESMSSFDSLVALAPRPYNLVGGDEPVRVQAVQATPGYLAMAGVQPIRGRGFLPDEGTAGQDRVTILSYGFWRNQLGGDPNVLERTLRLDGETYQVVGVAPENFFYFNPNVALWTPLVLEAGQTSRDQRQMLALGRLRDSVNSEEASTEAAAIAERLATDYPDSNRGWSARVVTVPDNFRQGVSFAATLLYSAITFVLLIACVNVANLILARSLVRDRELAMRASLGASRSRLVSQLLVESVTLALTGGIAGLLLGVAGTRMLRNWIAPDPNVGFIAPQIQADAFVLGHTIAISVIAGIVFGLIPAFKITRGQLVTVLKEGGRGGASRRSRFLGNALVTSEVALALALLVTATTLIRAFDHIYAADPGLNKSNLLTLELALPEKDYPEENDIRRFHREAQERLAAVPGVTSAASTTLLPLTQLNRVGTVHVTVEGNGEDADRDRTPNATDIVVSEDYFATLEISRLHGRAFEEKDREDGEAVAMVTEGFVERFLEVPARDGVGRRIRLQRPGESEPGPWRRIVGVVANHNSHAHSLRQAAPPPAVFVPDQQRPPRAATFVLKTQGPPLDLAASARSAIWDIDRTLPIDNVRSLEDAVAAVDTQNRFFLKILSGLALAALLLAAVGIYGIIAYSVNQRTRELGIRTALGAVPSDAIGLVTRQALILTTAGMAIGCGIAWMLVRFISNQLAAVANSGAAGPTTFVMVMAFFLTVALAASVVPSLRAAGLNPVEALRDD